MSLPAERATSSLHLVSPPPISLSPSPHVAMTTITTYQSHRMERNESSKFFKAQSPSKFIWILASRLFHRFQHRRVESLLLEHLSHLRDGVLARHGFSSEQPQTRVVDAIARPTLPVVARFDRWLASTDDGPIISFADFIVGASGFFGGHTSQGRHETTTRRTIMSTK